MAEADLPNKGRALVATSRIQPSEVVFKDNTCIARSLQSSLVASRCHFCWREAQQLSRCGRCQYAKYCSRDCQRSDWAAGHKDDCSYISSVKPRTPTSMCLLLAQLARASKAGTSECVELERLVSHMDERSEAQKEELVPLVALLQQRFADLDARSVLGWITRTQCNAVTVCDEELNPVGTALFMRVALLNHSCDPNCVVTYNLSAQTPPVAIVRAVRPIEPGDELTISYIDVGASTKERQKQLQEGYFFRCQCPRCTSSAAQDHALEGVCCGSQECRRKAATWAKGSGRPEIGWHETEDGDVSHVAPQARACFYCHSTLPVESEALLERAAELFGRAQHARDAHDAVSARRLFEECLSVQRGCMAPCNVLVMRSVVALTMLAIDSQDFKAALDYSRASLPLQRQAYPASSPVLGLALAMHGKLAWHAGLSEEAHTSMREACAVLSVTHGSDSELVTSLCSLLNEIAFALAHTR